MAGLFALALMLQGASVQTLEERRAEEVDEAISVETFRELNNAPFFVAENSMGTAWYILFGEVDKGSSSHQLVWVTIDPTKNRGTPRGKSKELWRIDCAAQTKRIELSETYDLRGEITNIYRYDPPTEMQPIAYGAPEGLVAKAFCP